jgi:hypothetical protein
MGIQKDYRQTLRGNIVGLTVCGLITLACIATQTEASVLVGTAAFIGSAVCAFRLLNLTKLKSAANVPTTPLRRATNDDFEVVR